MKIVRFKHPELGTSVFGFVEGEKVNFLHGNPLFADREFGCYAGKVSELKILAPCVPGKIICVAINFSGIDGFSESMREPLVFLKPASCLANPGDVIVNPFPDLPWWGEAELTAVIGSRVRNVSEDDVDKHVLGFTVANDTTVENVDHRDHHLARSKCPDKFCAVGPQIDTEFNADDCVIEAIQNGEIIRRGRSSQQFWQWRRIISRISQWMTLEPWDLVLTGNPPDTVGMRFLQSGDIYTARVQGLGELTNKFVVKES